MRKYEILKTGNFYLPVLDKGKKFFCLDTVDFEIKLQVDILKIMIKHGFFDFKILAEPIWIEVEKFVKRDSKYKNCWFVPVKLTKLGNKVVVSVDILKKAKK